jgi:carboxymethylenebutenolidase
MGERRIERALGRCCLAVPDASGGPGVLVLHAWWGLTPFFKMVCQRLAGEGFVALAPDLYHGVTASTDDEAKRLRCELDSDKVMREMAATVCSLCKHPAVDSPFVGILGFSLGAYLALRLARSEPDTVRAVVLFYANEGGSFDGARAAFLGHFASDDGCWVGARAVRSLEARLRAAGCEVTFHTYRHMKHSFFEEDRPEAYDAEAAQLAWERTVDFLRRKLGRTGHSAHTMMWANAVHSRHTAII